MTQATGGASVPVLAIIDGIPTTTSNEISAFFSKDHAKVLRDIRNLLDSLPDNHQANFGLVEYLDEKGEKRPAYRLTRDGFTLLAMGFTGKKALQFKIAYIDAFNRMEAVLRQESASRAETKEAPHDLVGLKWLLHFNPDGQPAIQSLPHDVFLEMEILLQSAQVLLRRLYGHEETQSPPERQRQPRTQKKDLLKKHKGIQRLVVINGQRVLQTKNEDSSWSNERIGVAGNLPPGVYNLFKAALPSPSRRYSGLVLHIDATSIYQQHGEEIIQHPKKKFHTLPARGSRQEISYDDNGTPTAIPTPTT